FSSIDEFLHQARSDGYNELIECGRKFVDRGIHKAVLSIPMRFPNSTLHRLSQKHRPLSWR
ncbi:MAG: hypothetical protein ACO3RV_07565, partial [Luteolibacter sp.]